MNILVKDIWMDYDTSDARMPICDLSNSDLILIIVMMHFFMSLSQHTNMPPPNNGTGGMGALISSVII